MLIQNPLPLFLVTLILLLPVGYLFIYRISSLFIREKLPRIIVSIAIFISTWMIILIYGGLITRSFVFGFTLSTVLLSLAGFITEILYQRNTLRLPDWQIERVNNSYKWMWLSATLSSLLIYFIATHGSFHDEVLVNGHKAIIAQLQNDFFPPRNLLYPVDALRYHFGFNVFCASLTAFTRCSVDSAIDVTTTLSWFYCWIVLWLIGEKLFKFRYAGLSVAAVTMFGGGLAPLVGLFYSYINKATLMSGIFPVNTDIAMNPPIVAYIFQHPFTAGLPLAAAIILLISDHSVKRSAWKEVLIAIMFITLYFCQTVLFITQLCVVTFYFVIQKKQYRFLITSAIIFIIVFISKSGLLFTPVIGDKGHELGWRFWPHHIPVSGIAAWYIGTFGFLLIFGFIGFFLIKDLRKMFANIILVSLAIPLFVSYRYTWDIVKFSTVASFHLGILSGGAIAYFLQHRKKWIRKYVFVGIAGLIGSGCLHALFLIYVEHYGEDKYYKKYNPQLTSDYVSSINWLRNNASADETVLCDPEYSQAFVVLSGIPTIFKESAPVAMAFGVPSEKQNRIKDMFANKTISIDDIQKFGIRWIIEDKLNSLYLDDLLQSDKFREEERFGNLKIYKVAEF